MTMIENHAPSRLSLHITRAEVGAGYLWLQYSIDPVPEAVRRHDPVRDVPCGIAADGCGIAIPYCRTSYRLALDWMHVVGVVAVGPDIHQRSGPVHVRFAPLVATPEHDRDLCDVHVEIVAGHVAQISARMLREGVGVEEA